MKKKTTMIEKEIVICFWFGGKFNLKYFGSRGLDYNVSVEKHEAYLVVLLK